MTDLRETTGQRLAAFPPGDYSESTGITLGLDLVARVTVTRLPGDEWPDFHPSFYSSGTVMRPDRVHVTLRWNSDAAGWEFSGGGIGGRKLKKDGTPGLVEIGEQFYGSMPYGESAWALPIIVAVTEHVARSYTLVSTPWSGD
jgi:hypothetical protein